MGIGDITYIIGVVVSLHKEWEVFCHLKSEMKKTIMVTVKKIIIQLRKGEKMEKKYIIPIIITLSIYSVLQFGLKMCSIDFNALPYIFRIISVLILFLPIIIGFILLGCDKNQKKGLRIFAFFVAIHLIACFVGASISEIRNV